MNKILILILLLLLLQLNHQVKIMLLHFAQTSLFKLIINLYDPVYAISSHRSHFSLLTPHFISFKEKKRKEKKREEKRRKEKQ
jgi:hypothetical protein